jgi:predicted RNase H-like nuclease (RuvC/YqgF family)
MSDTPRTDSAIRHPYGQWSYGLRGTCEQLERELAVAQNILKQCLSIMPVGYTPTHTVENLPEMIGDLAKALAEETTEREKLERELTAMTQRRDELLASLEKVAAYLSPPPSGD